MNRFFRTIFSTWSSGFHVFARVLASGRSAAQHIFLDEPPQILIQVARPPPQPTASKIIVLLLPKIIVLLLPRTGDVSSSPARSTVRSWYWS